MSSVRYKVWVSQNYDSVALTETWLIKDDQAEINVLTASGYSLCHLPRANTRGGGVGVLFKSTLSKISETPLTTDTFEGLSVTLQCPETKNNVRVYVIYRPPSTLPRDFLDDLGVISTFTLAIHSQLLHYTLRIYWTTTVSCNTLQVQHT